MQRTILEIVYYAVLAALVIVIWVFVGEDALNRLWHFQTDPYPALWEKYGQHFFATTGRPYLLAIYAAGAIFLVLLSFRLSIFVAKITIAITIAQTGLWYFGAVNIEAPQPYLIAAAVISSIWLVLSAFIVKVGLRQYIRNLYRKMVS